MKHCMYGLFAVFASICALTAGTYEIGFSNALTGWKVLGDEALLIRRDGMFFYDSSAGVSEKYRYLTLQSPEVMDGDFKVEFTFGIGQFDHWNSLRLSVGSVQDKAWNASLYRMKKQQGVELFQCVAAVAGKKVAKEVLTKELAGTLKIERTGSALSFAFRPDKADAFIELWKIENSFTGPATASISFDTPPNTASVVKLLRFSQRWSGDPQSAFTPVYLPRRVLADEKDGFVQLVVLEKGTRDPDGTLRIAPGGRAVYGIRGPLNCKEPSINWNSEGALKISTIPLGSAETIELGETLLWDSAGTEWKSRGASLAGLINRNAAQRRWNYPHLSCDNFLFVTVTPALESEIRFGGLTFSGFPLRMAEPFVPAAVASGKTVTKGDSIVLAWEIPAKADSWFENTKSLFKPGEVREFGGVAYMLNTTLLSPECPSVSIPAGAKAGMFYILHAAGPQKKDDSPLAAIYLFVYADGTTETVFAVLRWNCGVWTDGYLARGNTDFTWWGPPGFTCGAAHYLPKPPFGVTWDTVYSTRVMNPQPEKMVREVIAYQMPGDTRQFALLGISFGSPESSRIALVEPDEATFESGKPLGVNVMGISALPAPDTETTFPVRQVRPGGVVSNIGEVTLATRGFFFGGRTVVHPAGPAGPVRIAADGAESSLLGLMPEALPSDRPFLFTMIAGGGESRADFERIRRLGYDAVKIHLPWIENEPGKVEWPGWKERFDRIFGEGLKIGFRNHIGMAQPEYVRKEAAYLMEYAPGQSPKPLRAPDPADLLYRRAVVDYYREAGKLAAEYSNIVYSINANYGIRSGLDTRKLTVGKATLENFRKQLSEKFTIAELNAKLGISLNGFDEMTPEVIMADRSGTLLPELVKMNMADLGSLQREVVKAIRETGCSAHLTFNTPFHLTEHKLLGLNTVEYLNLSREFAPGSIFHETSDRYCLSFSKWLLARSLGLPYGDEGNQPPPTYEHNVLAYQWMAMMQCYDSLYCQWFGGKPAAQNVAQLKPFHKLLFNAEYLPDPVSLAVSLDSGFAESPEVFRRGLHQTTMPHYSLANLLRVLNINSDRFMMDRFPEQDGKVTSRLLIDDMSRDLSPAFGDRIETFMRNGGTFLATLDTDNLNRHAFFRRFGIETGKDGAISGPGVTLREGVRTVAEKQVGKGKLLILAGSWNTGHWDPGETEAYLDFARELMQREGGFRQLVNTDIIDVFATPYRTREGGVLIQLFNITAESRMVRVSVDRTLVTPDSVLFDHGTGTAVPTKLTGERLEGRLKLPALGSSVVRVLDRPL